MGCYDYIVGEDMEEEGVSSVILDRFFGCIVRCRQGALGTVTTPPYTFSSSSVSGKTSSPVSREATFNSIDVISGIWS